MGLTIHLSNFPLVYSKSSLTVMFGDTTAKVLRLPLLLWKDDFSKKKWQAEFFFLTLVRGPRRSSSLKLSEKGVCEPPI